MIRKYNYTGRKKLSEKIKITEHAINGKKTFDVLSDLKDLGLPDNAKIFIEPYFKSSFVRFDFGTVARVQAPSDLNLNDLPTTDQLRYRIKIVDNEAQHGLILAFVDIKGELTTDSSDGRQAILPVDFIDLGKRIWTLEFRTDRPVLCVNSSITNIREKVKSDDVFFSLVFPEVIKRIARELVEAEGFWEDELNGWQSEWIKFFREELLQNHLPIPNDPESQDEWSNDISEAFARKNNVFQRYTLKNN